MTVSYSELVTQIRAYTEVDSSVLSDTIVNDFIEFATADLNTRRLGAGGIYLT